MQHSTAESDSLGGALLALRYFLADRVVEMTVEMFREPRKMVQEISGLGLRHVAWRSLELAKSLD